MVCLPHHHPSERGIVSSSLTSHSVELLSQKANVGLMPPALKMCGSALLPHSSSVNASSAFALLLRQQWEALLPFKPHAALMPSRIMPPLTSSWLQCSEDLGHPCSDLCFGASPKPGWLQVGCMANQPIQQDLPEHPGVVSLL